MGLDFWGGGFPVNFLPLIFTIYIRFAKNKRKINFLYNLNKDFMIFEK